jgi:multiple sugar transport system permease protein
MAKNTVVPAQTRRGLSIRQREELFGWAFASIWIIGFFIFTAGPMVASFYLGFTQYSIANPPRWVGFENFHRALSGADSLFWPSMGRTILFAGVMVPISTVGALLAALLLNQQLKGTAVFRTLFFIPSLAPIVASAVLWRWMFQPEFGAINTLLADFGIQGPRWFADPGLAMPSLMIMTLWGMVGGTKMVIFLAGLQGVPVELHEAAQIDGAGTLHRFFAVTLPMITPTIFFNLIIGIIAALKTFSSAFVATNGGPEYATWFFILHLYQTAFQYIEMGYASALAWVFFVLVVGLTFFNVQMSRRWVYYEGEVK